MKGHRIRLDVASSNFPHFDVNPNSGEPEGYGHTPRPAQIASIWTPRGPRACCCRSSSADREA
ncbi:CocE/NonD family hydrolase C-terminal non-catalytic domain-containing protein [Caulobacter segnis]